MGRYDLNLKDREFWDLTLKELNALIDRLTEDNQRADYRVGRICAIIVNTTPRKSKKVYTAEDFMPGRKQTKQQTPKQMLSTVKMLNAAYGGSVKEK